MKVQIDDNYRIESDIASWGLFYESYGEINPETGRPILTTRSSFHDTIKQALAYYIDEKLKESGGEQMQSIKDVKSTLYIINLVLSNASKWEPSK